MSTVLKILDRLCWLGLVGVIGSLFNIPALQIFYLFFLFIFISFGIKIVLMYASKSEINEVNDLKYLLQNLKMAFGILVIHIKYKFNLPSIENFKTSNTYILPFKNEWFVANGGVDQVNSHSWSVPNQRYAYDFIISKDDKTYDGDFSNVENYYCYNLPIIAPADGKVVEIKNVFNDSTIKKQGEPSCDAYDIRGNYIMLQHSNNEYSLIGHIKKDSFSVKVGDFVSEGQLLAMCGNSGNTSEPHIHFQIQVGPSFYFSAGVPITFKDIIDVDTSEIINYIKVGQVVRNFKS